MRRLALILTKLSFDKDFNETSGPFHRFRQFAWIIGLLTLRITIDRIYVGKDV